MPQNVLEESDDGDNMLNVIVSTFDRNTSQSVEEIGLRDFDSIYRTGEVRLPLVRPDWIPDMERSFRTFDDGEIHVNNIPNYGFNPFLELIPNHNTEQTNGFDAFHENMSNLNTEQIITISMTAAEYIRFMHFNRFFLQ